MKQRILNQIEKIDVEITDKRKYGRATIIFLKINKHKYLERGKTMEIFTLLETLEDILENSKSLPFTNKGMVDKEEMLRNNKRNKNKTYQMN